MTDSASLKNERSLAQVPLSPTAWPAQDWWVGFGDSQLNTLIAEALKNNPTLADAEARARQAQAVADSLNAARDPQADLSASAVGARLSSKDPVYPEYALGSFAWAKSVTAGFSWDLDLWGGKRDAWEAALGRSRAVQIDAHAARIQLSVNVARAYVRLGYAFAQRDVADAEQQRASKSLALTRRLIEGGLGTTQQAYLADSQVASAEQQKVQADRAIDAARSSLSVLLGQGPDRGLAITRPQLLDQGMVALPDQLSVGLLGRRADLVAARWQVEAAAKDIKATKTEFLPNISLSAMAGVVAVGDSTNVFQLPARTFSIGPALSLPIFDGGRLRAKLAATDSVYDQSVARYNTLLVAALNDVSDQVSALKSVRTQIDLEKRAQQDAQKSWEQAITAYKGGVSGPLVPLISRQQLLLTDQRTAALESQQADISIQLIEALGGGYGVGDSVDLDHAEAAGQVSR
ncbi:efflux transporter outer membrane subunit [Rhodanobacter sp. A1T4]|uniref:efflux transporter outer membrane subunit n=1 Tax=Rhodanobacter sp. A1T4 TaxID=2723087 RepID=UPI0017DFC8EE|nr:NodT family efflux transporter outer membrane factor (OMF) lipoprotein [Rhodanobacter sp. A1T4]